MSIVTDVQYSNGCDTNVRSGKAVCEPPVRAELQQFSYPNIPDLVQTPNDNAHALFALCVDEDLLVVNNLKTRCTRIEGTLRVCQL